MENLTSDRGPSITPPPDPSTTLPQLSKELCARIPTEVWRLIASYTVDRYTVSVTEHAYAEESVVLTTNNTQNLTNMQLVSKLFNEGVKSGFRNAFSGRIYFGRRCAMVPAFVDNILSNRISWLGFNEDTLLFDDPLAYRTSYMTLNKAILSKRYPKLRSIVFKCFELRYLDVQESMDGVHAEEILGEAQDFKRMIKAAGLKGIDKMKPLNVFVRMYVGADCEAYALVRIRGKPKIAKMFRPDSGAKSKTLERMSFQKFIRLSARNEQEALETLRLAELQQTAYLEWQAEAEAEAEALQAEMESEQLIWMLQAVMSQATA